MWIAHKKAKYFTILDSGVKKMAVCNGLIVQESKDKYLEQDLCLLAMKTSFVGYKKNIFQQINQIKVFCFYS